MSSKYKEIHIGGIPKEWGVVRLGDILTLKNGERPHLVENGEYPVYGANGVMGHTQNYLVDNDFTLIIGRVGASGEVFLGTGKIWISDNAIYSEDYVKDKIYPPFLHYLLKFEQLNRFATKTTHPIITQSFLNSFQISFPPLPEQRKIAEILSTVDEAIQRVDEAIARTERLKRGLMQRLLTRGIGHREFRFSKELGCEIPREWNVVGLGDKNIAELIMGQSPPSSTYNKRGEGLPFLQGKMEFGEIYPSPTIYCSNPVKIAESNDILLSVRAPVGDVNIAPFECCIGRGVSAIRVKQGKLHHLFLFYYLKFNSKKFEALSAGSTFKAIRRQEIENYRVPLPPILEQQKITEILSIVDEKLELERKRKGKLEKIKRGLMNDLLTGKKRVKA